MIRALIHEVLTKNVRQKLNHVIGYVSSGKVLWSSNGIDVDYVDI